MVKTLQMLRHRSWLLVGLLVLFALIVRVHLRSIPLERDEGEYAYAGQLMLKGIPPYKEAYNMKLPGTYAAYALIMAVFGQSPSGIHFGLALVNAASIILMFLIGRRLLDEIAGVAAAAAFTLLSLSSSVLGLAGHATHFIVLPVLGGIWLLIRPSPATEGKDQTLRSPSFQLSTINHQLSTFCAGLLFGIAFLMKQHGVFFGLVGFLYLLWLVIFDQGAEFGRRRPRSGDRWKAAFLRLWTFDSGLWTFLAGLVLPYLLTCLVLWLAGVFHQFIFWTVSYAGKYASAVPLVYGTDLLKDALDVVVGPNLAFWLLPWAGALVMWWEERLSVKYRVLITVLFFCSFASASVGLHFRNHYFITVLPVLCLMSGIAVSRSLYLLRHDKTIELFLAVPILLAFGIGIGAALIGNGSVWFTSPDRAYWAIYKTTLFSEAAKVADLIKTNSQNSKPETRNSKLETPTVAVIGSEPEIYFCAHCRSATGYLYTYPLMEPQSYAAQMQRELIAEVERARPDYVVYVNDTLSWLPRASSDCGVFDWWKSYWSTNLDLMTIINVKQVGDDGVGPDPRSPGPPGANCLILLKRKAATSNQ